MVTNHLSQLRSGFAGLAATLCVFIAQGAINHGQRVHDPAGVGGDGVEIEPWQGGYMYLANHVSPYLLPANFNRRPVLVQTNANLKALAAYTYMKPGEHINPASPQLYLDSTDFFKTADDGFIICGNYTEGDEFGGGSLDYGAFLLLIDGTSLQPVWFRQYPGQIHFNSVVETHDSSGTPMYAVTGDIITVVAAPNPLVAGFDSNGNVIWAHELLGVNGGYGSGSEIIVYDANTLAVTGYAHGAPHRFCSVNAYADVLVARYQNDGTPLFVKLYGQTSMLIGGAPYSVYETGASLTRPTGSPDLVITGSTQAWSELDLCPGSPAFNDMLTFRIDPLGNVIWAHRYGIAGGIVSGVQIKPITAFLMIVANTHTQINSTYSSNVGYFRLMAGGGSLAAQTEIFGGTQADLAAGIIPLGPPYPFKAVMVGTSVSFGSTYLKPYLIERVTSIQRRCKDAEVPTVITPVVLPQHDLVYAPPFIPIVTQPLILLGEPVYDQVICRKMKMVVNAGGGSSVDFSDVDAADLGDLLEEADSGDFDDESGAIEPFLMDRGE